MTAPPSSTDPLGGLSFMGLVVSTLLGALLFGPPRAAAEQVSSAVRPPRSASVVVGEPSATPNGGGSGAARARTAKSSVREQGKNKRSPALSDPSRGVSELAPKVITATREKRSTMAVPSAVTAIGFREVERQDRRTLLGLMRHETGVFVQETTPGQGTPIVRGLFGSSVLMLVDGMRLNNAFTRPAPNQYFALVDSQIVRRIEVLRSTGSALYGSDAMGGVVKVITREPRFLETGWSARGRGLVRFSSADTSWLTRFEAEGGKRGVGVSAGITYQNHDDLRGGRDTGVQRPSGFSAVAADGKLSFEWEHHELLLQGQYLRQPKTPRYDELSPGFGQTEPSSAVFNFEPSDRLFVHLRYRAHRPFAFLDRLELGVAFQEMNDGRRLRDMGSTREDKESNRSRMIGLTLQLTSSIRDLMTLTYGFEIYFDRVHSRRVGQDTVTGTIEPRSGRFADGSGLDSYAFYLQDELRLHRKLTILLGGRVSYFDIDVPRADREVGARLDLADLTGSLGVLYRPVSNVSIVANLGRGFRVPNVFDLSTLGPRPGNRFSLPNPDLGPEQVVTVDAGVKLAWQRFRSELFVFHSSYQGKITDIPTGEVTADGRTVVQSVNLARQTLVGVEAGWGVRVFKNVEVYGSVNYTWAEERLPDGTVEPASRIPPLSGRLAMFVRPLPALWIDAGIRWALTQDRLSERDRRDPRIDPRGTGGKAIVDIRLGWRLGRAMRIRLSIENLFDQDFRYHGSGINIPGLNATIAVEARI